MKKAFLISLLTLLLILKGNFISAQGIKGFTASSEILFNSSDATHGPDVSLINNYKITRFPYIVQHTISSCLVDGEETTVEFAVEISNLLIKEYNCLKNGTLLNHRNCSIIIQRRIRRIKLQDIIWPSHNCTVVDMV